MKTLTKLARQRSGVPILNTVLVRNGVANATNMDTYINEPCHVPDGLYNGSGFDTDMPTLSKECKIDDFPIKDRDKGEPAHIQKLDLKTLLDDMTYVAKAMSKEATRYYLCGIALHNNNMVATDGHRLHMVTYKDSGFTDNIPGYSAGVIIPSNAVKLLIALMKEYKKREDEVNITLYKRHAVFEVASSMLQVRYMDVLYPQYGRVITDHQEENKTVFIQKEAKKALKRAKVIAKITDNSVKSITINDTGTAKLMPGSEYAEDFAISTRLEHKKGFNLQHLADMIDGDMYYGGAGDPVKIVNANRTGVIVTTKV